jgi:hypothetical protein
MADRFGPGASSATPGVSAGIGLAGALGPGASVARSGVSAGTGLAGVKGPGASLATPGVAYGYYTIALTDLAGMRVPGPR